MNKVGFREPKPNKYEQGLLDFFKRLRTHPMRYGFVTSVVVLSVFYYEVHVHHQSRVPSPNTNNQLEYDMKNTSTMAGSLPKSSREGGDEDYSNATLVVTPGQLAQREGYWKVRNNERNWSILAQDMQRQRDDYAYRLERSKDDDYGRHSSKRETKGGV